MRRPLLLVALVLLLLLAAGANLWLAVGHPGGWYRGNLHTHSLLSDGESTPQEMVERYRSAGYDFLALTEHDKLTRREDRHPPDLMDFEQLQSLYAGPRFLLIDGEEVSGLAGELMVHLNALNLRESVEPPRHPSAVEVIESTRRAVERQRRQRRRQGPRPLLLQVNHPNLGRAVSAKDLVASPRLRFFEVYNPLGQDAGDARHPSTDQIWDAVLAERHARADGLPLYGTAVDDAHRSEPYVRGGTLNGWVRVQARSLSVGDLFEAMEAGRFHASTGVALRSVAGGPSGLRLEVEPREGVAHTVLFLGTRRGGTPGEELARVAGDRAEYRFRGDELYVRARVESSEREPADRSQPQRAWAQPVPGPACPWPSAER